MKSMLLFTLLLAACLSGCTSSGFNTSRQSDGMVTHSVVLLDIYPELVEGPAGNYWDKYGLYMEIAHSELGDSEAYSFSGQVFSVNADAVEPVRVVFKADDHRIQCDIAYLGASRENFGPRGLLGARDFATSEGFVGSLTREQFQQLSEATQVVVQAVGDDRSSTRWRVNSHRHDNLRSLAKHTIR